MGEIYVVIPAHNEAATLRGVVAGVLEQQRRVIVVDDGSSDGTGEGIADLPVTLVRHPVNRGKAAALHSGFQAALDRGAEAVITLDGDGQHHPRDIPGLVRAWTHPRQLVIAARLRHRSAMPRARRIGNRIADFWLSWAAGQPVHDCQSGFRLYPAALLRGVEIPFGPGRGFVFESEILIEATRAGFTIHCTPIDCVYFSNARASHYRPWRDTTAIVRMVAAKLLARGLYPVGLLRSLGLLPLPAQRTDPTPPGPGKQPAPREVPHPTNPKSTDR